jgi:hypothetical protein
LIPALSLISFVVQAQARDASLSQIDPAGITTTIFTTPSEEATPGLLSFDERMGVKTIQLMKIIPSQALTERVELASATPDAEKDYSKGIDPNFQVDLGMGSVPVLDQGQYGTCVTFASTAVVDAAMGKGNYIDQQCSLELNKYLGSLDPNNRYDYWNGANDATEIIDPLKKYGIVQQGKCNYKYPRSTVKITPTAYAKLTTATPELAKVVDTYHDENHKMDINALKAVLKSGHRVAIGTLLLDSADPISVNGFDITVNGKSKRGGLWACKQPSSSSNYCGTSQAGHEIVVFGYDDTQELLKIRNSWSTKIGDNGNYYMTYAFYKAMVLDGTEVYSK